MIQEYCFNSTKNAISVKGASLCNYFQVRDGKLVSDFVTKEAVENTRLLINSLEKYNVKVIRQFRTRFQKYYDLTKTGLFAMVALLGFLQTA